MLRLEPRASPSASALLLAPLAALLLTALLGTLLFRALGFDPWAVFRAFFVTPLASFWGLGELGLKAAPLLLIALGLAVGFRAGVWNIGAEGQFLLGAILAGGLALRFPDVAAPWLPIAMAAAGIAGGLLWAAVPALLRTRLGVNEILTSLMLTYVASLLLSALVYGPWRDPEGFGFPQTPLFPEAALLPVAVAGTRLHVGVWVALALVPLVWLLLRFHLFGFATTVLGQAPRAARYAGFAEARLVWSCLLLSGGLAGLAGMFEVAGPIGQLTPEISPGYGFTAIIVAFLGRLHPLGLVPASLLVALAEIGAENAQIEVGLPRAAGGVFQGLLLFLLLASEMFVRYRPRLGPGRAPVAKEPSWTPSPPPS